MGTLMTWVFSQVVLPVVCCQTVVVPRWTARAAAAPPGPGASVAVPEGSGGSGCQVDPASMVWPRCAVVMTAAVVPGPNDAEAGAAPWSGSGGDRVQWLPSGDQAASRLAPAPVPAWSNAVMPCAVRVSR